MEYEVYNGTTKGNVEDNATGTGQVYSETNGNIGGFLLKDTTRGDRIERSLTARQRRRELKNIKEEIELNRYDRLRSERKKLKKMKKKGLHIK